MTSPKEFLITVCYVKLEREGGHVNILKIGILQSSLPDVTHPGTLFFKKNPDNDEKSKGRF